MTKTTENNNATQTLSLMKLVHKGYILVFRDGADEIEVYASAISGKEKVYFNGDIVSEKRNMAFTTRHEFTVGKNSYRVTLIVTSCLRGGVECSLHKNGRKIGYEEQILYQGSWAKIITILLGCMTLGIATGYSTGYVTGVFMKWMG